MFDVMSWMEQLGRNTKGEPQFPERLGERIQRVIGTMQELSAGGMRDVSGKVTVEFAFDMAGQQVVTTTKISSKEPAEGLPVSTSYIGPDGRLCDIDPRQISIQFKAPETGSAENRGAGGNGAAKGTGGGGDLKAPER